MVILDVIIEYAASSLNRPFSYAYFGKEKIVPGVRVLVPFGNKKIIGYVESIKEVDLSLKDYISETGINVKEIYSLIDYEPILNDELMQLANDISSYYFASKISVYQTMLPPSLKPKSSSLTKPKIAYDVYVQVIDEDISDLTAKQKELYQRIKEYGLVLKKDLKTTLLPKLEEKNKIRYIYKEKTRLIQEEVKKVIDPSLNEEQLKALNEIVNGEDTIYLLEGVTGSGKTEVYLQAAKKVLEEKKTVLMLVPEISLSIQMVRRFKSRFDNIAILHSDLTSAEKYDEYRRINKGEVNIVVGARSAIFAPLKNIGLIIIDEEHVETYKQEVSPYYDARKVALFRQKYNPSCKIIFGSATPSLETKIRALKGLYRQLYLTKRFNDVSLPETEIIDMLDYHNIDKESVIFSLQLRHEIQDRLNKKEQIMLLVNRRGFAPHVSCRKCGTALICPECNLPYSYHSSDNLLKCHHCDRVSFIPSTCPKCGGVQFSKVGFGTEKVELEIARLFPTARVLRLDSDVASIRSATGKVIKSFENQEADILVGTQIIAKGHDFQNVTLVGIVLADLGLNIPSFRAAERTFCLLTQAIGRAGRSTKVGKAIIQTYMPKNYVIYDASIQDYYRFFNEEMLNRKLGQYPPYTYCTILTLSSKNEKDVIDSSIKIKYFLETKFANKKVDIIGPSSPFLMKVNNKYRRKILLKYKQYNDIYHEISELIQYINKDNKVEVSVNVDPSVDY